MRYIIFSLLFLCSLASCSKTSNDDITPTKFIIATSADNPPYEFLNNGKIVGFDIDLAEAIAKELGQELIIKNLDFPGLLPSLLSNNVDAVIAGLTVTPERLNNVDFSDTYSSSEMAVIFRDGMEIDSNQDLQKKTIGAQFGTTWEDYAKNLIEESKGGKIKSLSNNLALIQELNNKNVDIVVMEKMQVNKFTSKYPELKSMVLPETRSDFAIAFPKSSELTEKVNSILDKFRANGYLDHIKSKWLEE